MINEAVDYGWIFFSDEDMVFCDRHTEDALHHITMKVEDLFKSLPEDHRYTFLHELNNFLKKFKE